MQQTSIVPAVHDVQRALGGSAEWASWLGTVYLMVATVATMAMGRLGDLHGRRRLLLTGLALFAVGSIGAAPAPDLAVLIGFRAVQEVGASVYPLALALARESVPEDRQTTTISLLTGGFGAGTAIGFAAGGVLAQFVSWRAIFAFGAVLVAVAAWLVARRVPEPVDRAIGRFDLAGSVLVPVAALALLDGLTVAASAGWTAPLTIGLLVWPRSRRRRGCATSARQRIRWWVWAFCATGRSPRRTSPPSGSAGRCSVVTCSCRSSPAPSPRTPASGSARTAPSSDC
ncbi:MFS transporter [Amycolatopsis sp. FDAARGOS 1241]|nr:MFS transporter [Amycolatopsis sp. FDAARGOS 1241]